MRIKRFIAPDMRSALRMVREEQGPDAVILSNRAVDGGSIEVVAATDYDEALVQQALRAAGFAPMQPLVIAAASPAMPPAARLAPAMIADAPEAPATAAVAATPGFATEAAARTSGPRETLVSRARAVFGLGDADTPRQAEATLAELIAMPAASPEPAPTRFEAMMAALAPPLAEPAAPTGVAAIAAHAVVSDRALAQSPIEASAPSLSRRPLSALDDLDAAELLESITSLAMPASAGSASAPLAEVATDPAEAPLTLSLLPIVPKPAPSEAPRAFEMQIEPIDIAGYDAPMSASVESACTSESTFEATDATDAVLGDALPPTAEADAAPAVAAPTLRIVAAAEADPVMAAMREEMSSMRQLIERQMGQFALERLRGSRSRAAAYEALIGYGCEDVLAQAVAGRIDADLDPARIHAPMLAELARTITIARSEPLDEGGVIALVGPTGAGKTTTIAKLAARYSARHRARDVALVTTDGERAGAREQLHAHGRRLGITVCEAEGPESLHATLEQLADYPLVLVDTAGFAARDRAVFSQILWLRSARRVRSLLVLPANAHPHDLGEVIRRYRPAAPEGVVLTKLDETGRLGSALSVLVRHGLSLAYTTDGQQVPTDLHAADADRLVMTLEKLRRAADNPLATEDRHALA